jgi:hypothetical protein
MYARVLMTSIQDTEEIITPVPPDDADEMAHQHVDAEFDPKLAEIPRHDG